MKPFTVTVHAHVTHTFSVDADSDVEAGNIAIEIMKAEIGDWETVQYAAEKIEELVPAENKPIPVVIGGEICPQCLQPALVTKTNGDTICLICKGDTE